METYAFPAFLALVVALPSAPVAAQSCATRHVSVNTAGEQANGTPLIPGVGRLSMVAPEGRFVVFVTESPGLVPDDNNGVHDVFVRDMESGRTTRVSVSSTGEEGNATSHQASISADGRYVAFASLAGNLVADDDNTIWDVFVRDRAKGTTQRVSLGIFGSGGNNHSFGPSISYDGKKVAFFSTATNLVHNTTHPLLFDVFVHDLETGETELASVDSNGETGNWFSYFPSLSGDGRFVAFYSLSSFVPEDTNGSLDVYVRDLVLGRTTLASVSSTGEVASPQTDQFQRPVISRDGRLVAFASPSTNLVPGDLNGRMDVFVHDRQTGETTRVSVSSAGVEADADCYGPWIAGDGRYVAFVSSATNLVPGLLIQTEHVYLHDRLTGETTLASVNGSGFPGTGASDWPTLTHDGVELSFQSLAPNLSVPFDTNGNLDVFLRDCGPPAPGQAVCFGDGTGVVRCPCGNESPDPGDGCRHTGSFGMRIFGTGSTSIAADDLALVVTDAPPSNPGIFVSGTSLAASPAPLYDGLLCIGGSVLRYRGRFQAFGEVSDTGFVAQDPFASYFVPGTTYQWQYFTRDNQAGATPCGAAANLSPAYAVTMTP